MPQTYNTKKKRLGTAWQATEGGGRHTPPRPRDDSRNKSNVVDPEFDFPKSQLDSAPVLSPSKVSPKQSFALAKQSSSIHNRRQEENDNDKICASTQTDPPSEETKNHALLETKMKELETFVRERQAEMQAALDQKDKQIQTMADNLAQAQKERDALQARLEILEATNVTAVETVDKLEMDLASQKQSWQETSAATASRLSGMEDTTAQREKANTEQMDKLDSALLEHAKHQNNKIQALMERTMSNQAQIQQLQSSLEQQNQATNEQLQAMKKEVAIILETSSTKDKRVKELEAYIEKSTQDTGELKKLLLQMNRTFAVVAAGEPPQRRKPKDSEESSKKRKMKHGHESGDDGARRKKADKPGTKNEQGDVNAWLATLKGRHDTGK